MERKQDKGLLLSWRLAVLKSDLAPTTRHVLLTLSIHMNAEGQSCYPSTRTLGEETGLSERSVCSHLEIAKRRGWLSVRPRARSGQGWKRHEYGPLFPGNPLKEVQHVEEQGTERDSAGYPEGTEPDDKKALKEVQLSKPVNSSSLKKEYIDIFNFWNSKEITVHRDHKNFIPHIKAKINPANGGTSYTPEEIKEAISNYSAVLESPDHFFSYRWGLAEFLTRKNSLDKFLTVNRPLENFRSRNQGSSVADQAYEEWKDAN